MEYNETLNLPKTDFPMRAKLPQREPEVLAMWEREDIYQKVQEQSQGKPKFILHDGPPYANGNIHLGHTLNKVLKDMVVKYRSMAGYDAPYVPGWDTHGLPIEQQAIKNLGLDRDKTSIVEFRNECTEYALKFVEIQKEQFKRLGIRGDWDRPYITLAPEFEAAQIGVFGEMAKKGFIYKGLKPVYWCADCQTALAEAEIDYQDKKSPSIFVKFAVKDGLDVLPEDNTFVVIWTTTPWTIPANLAIAVQPQFEYVLLETPQGKLLVAKELSQQVMEQCGIEDYSVVGNFQGSDLERIVCRHPLFERDSLVILGDHVTLEQGTGCVHTAPGHGLEDYEVGKAYNLQILSPIDDNGRFTDEVGQFSGLKYDEGNKAVTEALDQAGALLNLSFIKHQYPHCWRCKHPVIFRATEQWFASIDGFRQNALDEIDQVQWIPAWGKDRIHNMVAERGDWCISRQRTWGVPIPIFYCDKCNKEIINDETINHVQDLFREHGSNIWFAKEANELVPEGLKCDKCGHGEFHKETDIMDVWFDSGSSHAAVLEQRPELAWPADLYLEGSDQHRGWFNSSLSTAVATRGKAPYKAVLTHGFLVDEKGRKMSKSLGNGIDPMEVSDKMGADILRLWVSSADYKRDVAASPNIMKQMTEAYRKIRNTSRFIISNLYDFDPSKDMVSDDKLSELDRWALMRLNKLVAKVTNAYETYEFHVVYHAVHNFCVVDMSSFYLDIIKDRLYCSEPDSDMRRAIQTTIYKIIDTLVRLLAPVLAFTSEEIWQHLPKEEDLFSVQLAAWPQVEEKYFDVQLEEKWAKIISIREEVAKVLEKARQQKVIGHSLNAQVNLYAGGKLYEFLEPLRDRLSEIFIVSDVRLLQLDKAPADAVTSQEVPDLTIQAGQAPGEKCERCWQFSDYVGQDPDHTTVCKRCATVVKNL
ncbi:isoleucine--tRNA ligase [Metallumcola ferriviriculae]|uniref:Isoleucine--tRNA ligase n=1 Tax=Metallumcola ferriviriculae TaxID=3039180 RepID=A0AAU0UML6_9FIRM|nr:isoleucine--tRNA ligase [Desulfitibacteraceae bacterium MK1]